MTRMLDSNAPEHAALFTCRSSFIRRIHVASGDDIASFDSRPM